MKKPFLLIAGDCYYPSDSTGDWIGCFSTREEAESKVRPADGVVTLAKYQISNNGGQRNVDWYEIIDLRNWQ